MQMNPLSVVFGCAGSVLTPDEARFFRDANPLGFILFSRNCIDPQQVSVLVTQLREAVGRSDAPVFIDQEGGRVARLKPPHWPAYPAARVFGDLATSDLQRAAEAARLNAFLIGSALKNLGITVNCAPVIDVPVSGAHEMIGTRALSTDPSIVAHLGAATCMGLLAANVLPVIKHLPGYGRAFVNAHKSLPVIAAPRSELARSDFVPFAKLATMPWGMTAHALFTAIDADSPATLSATVISEVIRAEIGFQGILITDDLSMEALEGGVDKRAMAALRAGCDIALHCNGTLNEMAIVASVVSPLSAAVQDKINEAESKRNTSSVIDYTPTEARLRLESLISTRIA